DALVLDQLDERRSPRRIRIGWLAYGGHRQGQDLLTIELDVALGEQTLAQARVRVDAEVDRDAARARAGAGVDARHPRRDRFAQAIDFQPRDAAQFHQGQVFG